MIRIAVDKSNYEDRPGSITNQRIISEYSVRADHRVSNDRSNARYLIEENIRDGVNFDLKEGLSMRGTYMDKGKHQRNVPSLQCMSRWAVGQNGATIKEVFGDADFAARRGTLKRIASTLVEPKDPWTIAAQDFGGVILLAELSKKYHGGSNDVGTYTGFKFEQYMTTSEPNGLADTHSPVDNRPLFKIVVRSDLTVAGETHKISCCGEIDALSGDEPTELKSCSNPKYLKQSIPKMMQSEILGLRRIIVGVKKEDHILDKVYTMSMEEYINTGRNREKSAQCYSFLFKILSEIKYFLVDNDACRVSYDPKQKVVEIKSISRQEAKIDFGMEKGGTRQFITEKLQERFKEVTKAWVNTEKNETAAEPIPTASERAAAKPSRYSAPGQRRGGNTGPGGKTNRTMFPSVAAAEQMKRKKDAGGSKKTAGVPGSRPGAYVPPRGDPWGGSSRAAAPNRDDGLSAVRAMGASVQPAPVRALTPAEIELRKAARQRRLP